MKPLLIFFTALAMALSANTAWAKMYKWVDDEGQTHYTQTPPPEYAREQGSVAPPPPPSESPEKAAERFEKMRKNLQEDIEAEQKAEEEQKESRKAAKEQADRCKKAKTWLRQLENNARLREVNEDGEYVVLDDSVRQERLDKARELVKKECGN
ncbi:MAG: DUF4124 domain-containing protein [Pseudomonadota bacterium]